MTQVVHLVAGFSDPVHEAQQAFTGILQRLDNELIIAARRIDAHSTVGQYAHAVAWIERYAVIAAAEHCAANLGVTVFE